MLISYRPLCAESRGQADESMLPSLHQPGSAGDAIATKGRMTGQTATISRMVDVCFPADLGSPGVSCSRTWYSRKDDDAANILNSSRLRRYHYAVFRLKSPSTVAVELRTGGLQAGKRQELRERCHGRVGGLNLQVKKMCAE